MERFRSSARPVGFSLGLILVVVGLVIENYGLVGLGIVFALAGHFTDSIGKS